MARPSLSSSVPPQLFAPGARVEVRGEEWVVRRAELTSTGDTAIHVTGLSELVRNKSAIFLSDIDREMRVLKPEETELVMDTSPGYRRSRLYLESLLRQSPPTDAALYRGHRGAMNAADYQLVPAGKALAQTRPRLLIADAVGLGKTIEVGILLSELIRRGRGRRILVVALKSILEQFQEELWARFTIPLVRLDSVGLERVQRKIPANQNPFYFFDRVIISIDTLKKDEKYSRFLRQCHWDAVVIDECQHVAARTAPGSYQRSQRSKLAELLARTSEALILTSATPHDGKKESFASLVNLLEPTAIADDQDYTADDVQGFFVRRFKKDVQHEAKSAFRERELLSHRIDASAAENAVFEALSAATFRTIHPRKRRTADVVVDDDVVETSKGRGILFRTLLLKAFLSSPEALTETLTARLKHNRLKPDVSSELDADAQADTALLTRLHSLASAIAPKHNTKLQHLVRLLKDAGVGPNSDVRVVIFSERIATLTLLEAELTKALKLKPAQVAVFHGTLDDQSQQKLVKDFGNEKSQVRLLLASDAASEGINLHHFCHRMVHYDIPWSLITLEQRNGRIDRYGQTERPALHYLLSIPQSPEVRGDLRVLDLLVEKEDAAHKNLGDVQWLMRLHSPEAEADRIAEGISQKEDPNQIIPDATPPSEADGETDLLAVLLGMAQAHQEAEAASQLPLWTQQAEPRFGATSSTSPASTTPPVTRQPLSLFASDLDFAKDAFEQLLDSQPPNLPKDVRLEAPAWEPSIDGFILRAPLDLRQRYATLPPELQRSKEWEFRLTVDRERVQRALLDSRRAADGFPEYELFWEQHPIAEWLNDRMAAHFLRHEAPVLQVHQGISPEHTCFLFQGVLSNSRSQPMVAEWFGVLLPRAPSGTSAPIVPFSRLMADFGLTEPLINPATVVALAELSALREQAVAQAAAHMKLVRQARSEQLKPQLQDSTRKLKTWEKRKLEELQAKVAKNTTASGTVRKDLAQRYEAQRQAIADQMEARRRWLSETLSTSETPYLRLAAVFVAAPSELSASQSPAAKTSAKSKKGAR